MLRSSLWTFGMIIINPLSFVDVLPFTCTSIRLKFGTLEENIAEENGPVLFKIDEFEIVIVLPYMFSSPFDIIRAMAPYRHESEHTLPDTVSWSNVTSSYSMPSAYKALDVHAAHSLFFKSTLYTDKDPWTDARTSPAQLASGTPNEESLPRQELPSMVKS